MDKYLVLNGPNLGALGRREPGIYGTFTLDDILERLRSAFPAAEFVHLQSNHEGVLIDALLTAAEEGCKGVILNAGAYTHTSLAIADAIRACTLPVVEVHISNIYSRESVRHTSMLAPACKGVVAGFGVNSYLLAAQALMYGE